MVEAVAGGMALTGEPYYRDVPAIGIEREECWCEEIAQKLSLDAPQAGRFAMDSLFGGAA